jgi:hypothetical protein
MQFDAVMIEIMRWLLAFLRTLFSDRPKSTTRPRLIGMYFGENNSGGRKKSNRDRA